MSPEERLFPEFTPPPETSDENDDAEGDMGTDDGIGRSRTAREVEGAMA